MQQLITRLRHNRRLYMILVSKHWSINYVGTRFKIRKISTMRPLSQSLWLTRALPKLLSLAFFLKAFLLLEGHLWFWKLKLRWSLSVLMIAKQLNSTSSFHFSLYHIASLTEDSLIAVQDLLPALSIYIYLCVIILLFFSWYSSVSPFVKCTY